jgi:hypothetical protein
MSRSTQLNVVILEGTPVADPEIRSTPNGNRVAILRVANTIVVPHGDRGGQHFPLASLLKNGAGSWICAFFTKFSRFYIASDKRNDFRLTARI